MLFPLLLILVVAGAGVYFFQAEPVPAGDAGRPLVVEIVPSFTPASESSPSPAVNGPVLGESALLPTPRAAAAVLKPAMLAESSEPSPTPTDDCNGQEVHINERDGKDVQVDIDCDKTVENGGNISNSVSIDARTGGTANSGDVAVDITISNKVGP